MQQQSEKQCVNKALETKLQDFENFVNNKIFVCQPACLTTRTDLPPKLLRIIIASILSPEKGYFSPIEPLLF